MKQQREKKKIQTQLIWLEIDMIQRWSKWLSYKEESFGSIIAMYLAVGYQQHQDK